MRDRIRPVAQGAVAEDGKNRTGGSSEAGMGTVLNKPRTSAALWVAGEGARLNQFSMSMYLEVNK